MTEIERIIEVSVGFFRPIDRQFAKFVCELEESPNVALELMALLLSSMTGNQHTAFDIFAAAEQPLEEVMQLNEETGVTLPAFNEWYQEVIKCEKVVGLPGERKPIILDEGLAYLGRYYEYQKGVVDAIVSRTKYGLEPDLVKVADGMKRLFESAQDIDWQEVAAFAALRNRFCVISGGPGTGKTTTVAKVLALLLTQEPALKIDLVAPTGKAADRLVKSIVRVKGELDYESEVLDLIPEEASTIHRYLGYIPNSTKFRFNAKHRTYTQVLLVDEASMVSLPMFAKLLAALQDNCRVILLGDKDQLAAVEIGNVLGDITSSDHVNCFSDDFCTDYSKVASSSKNLGLMRHSERTTALQNAVVKLMFSHRFGTDSGIGNLANAVNDAESEQEAMKAVELLHNPSWADISMDAVPSEAELKDCLTVVVQGKVAGWCGYSEYRKAVKSGDPAKALAAFDHFQILCAVRQGTHGVEAVNAIVERTLFTGYGDLYYPGRAVMITVNDYNLHLFNGDVGVILPDENGKLKAWFPTEGGELRSFSTALLPAHSTAFAMTVHKSQGSEFNDVLLILPDRDSRILTKEIVYTGITRAKENVKVWADQDIFVSATVRRITRTSGLRRQLAQ